MDPSVAPPLGLVPGGGVGAELAMLLTRSSRGDQEAFAELYDRTSARIYGLAKRVVRDSAQAEEVAQEAYMDIWRQSAQFDSSRGGVLTWMLTITHRRAVDRVRSAEAGRQRDTKFATLGEGGEYDVVAEQVSANLDSARVRKALAGLTEVQREALLLAYYGGYTYKEVAELLDVPLGTIKTRMRDGIIRLRDMLGVET